MNTLKCRLQAKEDDGSENGEDDAEGGEVSFFFFGNSLSGDGTLSDLSFRDRFSNVCIFFAETDRPRRAVSEFTLLGNVPLIQPSTEHFESSILLSFQFFDALSTSDSARSFSKKKRDGADNGH